MKNDFRSITEDLQALHDAVRAKWPCLTRIAVALYDDKTDLVHTFVRSSPTITSLNHYSIELSKVPSLQALAESGLPRLIQDLNAFSDSKEIYTKAIVENFKSSYTEPFYLGDNLVGFVFYDAEESNYFSEDLLTKLKSYTRLIESMIVSEVLPIKALVGMVDTTKDIIHIRDTETAKHLTRVASYVEIIAFEVAEEFDFSDEQIEYLWNYAPLHDIGKVALPDSVLLKEGRFTDDEFALMQTHVAEGLKVLEMIAHNFSFKPLRYFNLLQDIVGSHHERWNGSGYPLGLSANEIPPIGRVMAVADVFDALANKRSYRSAWPLDKVFEYFEDHSGDLFDPSCVKALLKHRARVSYIANEYRDLDEEKKSY